MPSPPDYIYPGQIFDEMGSLAQLMPNHPVFALELASMPGSRDVRNGAARLIMQDNIDPYSQE